MPEGGGQSRLGTKVFVFDYSRRRVVLVSSAARTATPLTMVVECIA
jgi:hypothetical protein